jgi:hypothetical protein
MKNLFNNVNIIHYGANHLDYSKIKECSNMRVDQGINKPANGFWACPIGARHSWKWFIKNCWSQKKYTLSQNIKCVFSGRVFEIRTISDIKYLYKYYKIKNEYSRRPLIDWERVVREEHVDAIYFAQSNFDFDTLCHYQMTSWDCDSLVVFNYKCLIQK